MRFGELLLDTLNGGIAQMIVVVVRDDNSIDHGKIFEFARRRCVALEILEVNRRAAVLEDRVK